MAAGIDAFQALFERTYPRAAGDEARPAFVETMGQLGFLA
jgi:hypothetical protein